MKQLKALGALALSGIALGTTQLASAETTTPVEDLVLVEESTPSNSADERIASEQPYPHGGYYGRYGHGGFYGRYGHGGFYGRYGHGGFYGRYGHHGHHGHHGFYGRFGHHGHHGHFGGYWGRWGGWRSEAASESSLPGPLVQLDLR